MRHVLGVAIAIVAIARQGRGCRPHDAKHGEAIFTQMGQVNVPKPIERRLKGKAADLEGLEPRLLDQPGAQGVVCDGKLQQLFARHKLGSGYTE